MADTKLSPIDALDADIAEAWANYRLRLAAFDHCPSTQNELDANDALELVDALLDDKLREMQADAMVKA